MVLLTSWRLSTVRLGMLDVPILSGIDDFIPALPSASVLTMSVTTPPLQATHAHNRLTRRILVCNETVLSWCVACRRDPDERTRRVLAFTRSEIFLRGRSEWLWGGMQYQLEHHLFPTMPRYKYPRLMKAVEQFGKDNNLEYRCVLFVLLCMHIHTCTCIITLDYRNSSLHVHEGSSSTSS
jgi:hypothetical protein